MGKASKKKKKNADFVKPKLRVGKRKPVATNFTSIDFKSSAINILSQLEEKAEPTNRRNLSLKDILHQMDHYNDNTRMDATESLKNFFLQYPSSLHQKLSIFITKLLSKSVDLHFNVRRNFISCLEHIFQNVGNTEIQPFFPVIMAHLSCAMTHINEEIQTDSLKFLGLCLDMFPLLFLENCGKVFHNFLDMVYQSQGLTVGRKNLSGPSTVKSFNRDVLVKPIGKLANSKVKKDILEKLLKIVSLVFTSNSDNCRLQRNMENNELPVTKSINRICLVKYGLLCCQKEYLACNGRNKTGGVIFPDGAKAVKDAILSFIPVLFQCWNDCKTSNGTSTVMEDSSIQIMTSIASILRDITASLATSNGMELFTKTYFYDFTKYFLENFPFSFTIARKKQAKYPQQELNTSAISLNISICEVYCNMIGYSQALALENSSQLKVVLGYIRSLSHDIKLSKIADCLDSVQEIVCILLELLFRWESQSDVDKIFKPVYDIMRNITFMYKEATTIATKLQILPILEKLLHLKDIFTCPTDGMTQIFEPWINLLPNDLQNCDPENSEFLCRVITVVLIVLSREQMAFDMRPGLHCAINHVIGAPKSIFTVATCEVSLQRQFLEIIYHLPQLDMDLLKSLSFLCHRKETHMNTKNYTLHIVYYCLQKGSVDLHHFLMFLMSVLVGSSLKSLESTQSLQEPGEFSGIESLKYKIRWNFKNKKDEAHIIADHVESCKVVLDLVQTLDCKADILFMLLPTLDQLLTNFRVLPNVAVLGLLFLIYRLQEFIDLANRDNFKNFSDKLAELLFSVTIYHATIESNRMKSCQWNEIAFDITCKLLCFHHNFLDGWITTAISALGLIEDDIIAKSLRCFKGQLELSSKLEHIFTTEERTESLRKLYYMYANGL